MPMPPPTPAQQLLVSVNRERDFYRLTFTYRYQERWGSTIEKHSLERRYRTVGPLSYVSLVALAHAALDDVLSELPERPAAPLRRRLPVDAGKGAVPASPPEGGTTGGVPESIPLTVDSLPVSTALPSEISRPRGDRSARRKPRTA